MVQSLDEIVMSLDTGQVFRPVDGKFYIDRQATTKSVLRQVGAITERSGRVSGFVFEVFPEQGYVDITPAAHNRFERFQQLSEMEVIAWSSR